MFILIKSSPLKKRTVPVTKKKAVIKFLGENSGFLELWILVKNGAGAGGAASFFELGKFF